MIKPSEIRAASNKVEKENMQFRSYLKRTADSDELDQRFHDLHEIAQNAVTAAAITRPRFHLLSLKRRRNALKCR